LHHQEYWIAVQKTKDTWRASLGQDPIKNKDTLHF
jgi:hypothetical protein